MAKELTEKQLQEEMEAKMEAAAAIVKEQDDLAKSRRFPSGKMINGRPV